MNTVPDKNQVKYNTQTFEITTLGYTTSLTLGYTTSLTLGYTTSLPLGYTTSLTLGCREECCYRLKLSLKR